MDLAEIYTPAHNELAAQAARIAGLTKTSWYWIGIDSRTTAGIWVVTKTNTPILFRGFGSGSYRDYESGRCAHLRPQDAWWSDYSCSTQVAAPYICSKRI